MREKGISTAETNAENEQKPSPFKELDILASEIKKGDIKVTDPLYLLNTIRGNLDNEAYNSILIANK